MRRLLLGIIILFFSVWVGLKIAHDPGLALFTYNTWSVEMPLWFAVICLFILIGVVYFLVRLMDGVDASFYRWKNWLRWRRKSKSYSKTNRGLLELIEGSWRQAENSLLEGIDQSDAPLINYLAAAKAAQERGAFDKRDMYLRQAHGLSPHGEIAIGLTQARLQLEQGQLEQSLATLNRLVILAPKNTIVLKLLKKVYSRLGDGKGLLKLLPALRKRKVVTTAELEQLELNAYQTLLANIKTPGLTVLHDFWKTVPRRLQKNPQMLECYITRLLPYTEVADEMEELIHHSVKKNWNENLVRLYGKLITNSPKKQLIHAEKWQKKYPDQAVLLLVLANLCMRCQLWGKARHYLDESLKLAATPELYVEYGKLAEQMGDMTKALQHYRDGLRLTLAERV